MNNQNSFNFCKLFLLSQECQFTCNVMESICLYISNGHIFNRDTNIFHYKSHY